MGYHGLFHRLFYRGSDIYMDMMNEDNLTATLAREISMKNLDYNWKDRVLHIINYSASEGDTEARIWIDKRSQLGGTNNISRNDLKSVKKYLTDRGFKVTTDRFLFFPATGIKINW